MSERGLGGDPPCWAHRFEDDRPVDDLEPAAGGSGGAIRGLDHRGRDLDDRGEVAEFVTRFYREIAQDDGFHLYFDTIAHVDWHAHTLDLTDFWAGILIGEPDRAADDVIEAHRWLHDTEPFDPALFDRWLEILDVTLDEGWTGPGTEKARKRGRGLAWAMAKRLTGESLT